MIHHLAIATPNLLPMIEFYKSLPGLNWIENKFTKHGIIRSAWFQTEEGTILMLEDFPYSKAPEALIFKMEESYFPVIKLFPISKKTEYTIYFLDPDKNQLGYSSYPVELKYYSK